MDLRTPRILGRTGLKVGRLGVAGGYGVPAVAVERAFHDYGVNYFYWGSFRKEGMADAIRNLKSRRDELVIALQSYDRSAFLMPFTFERGLSALGLDYADVLILGWHNQMPSQRILDAAHRLKEQGKLRHIAMSCHNRAFLGELARTPGQPIDIFMLRYNAAHRGAEQEIFPHLPKDPSRPGVTAYTATSWGKLLKSAPPGLKPLRGRDCYRFALTHPAVDLCMTGPADSEQMDEALKAIDEGPMSQEELQHAIQVGDFVHG